MAAPRKPETADDAVTLANADLAQMSKNERIKVASRGLYYVTDGKKEPHAFGEEMDALDAGENPTISGEAKELSKFFGIYKQQGRGERGRKTRDFFFMVRIKNPGGGILDARQWAALDDAAEQFADGTLRVTSRQAIQYHHVYGPSLAPLIRHLNREYRKDGSLSACGDVNRNVMCSPVADLDPRHDTRARELAEEIAEELAPRTTAYFQIFLSDTEGRKQGVLSSDEPLYGEHYLPRKFKIGIAHPGDNSVDALTNDIGFVPVANGEGVADGELWDLWTGGGMGLTHNNPKTAPHLGLHLGRVRRDQVVETCKAIAILQKEHGERKDRRLARWKYTLRRLGTDTVKEWLKSRFGIELEEAGPAPVGPVLFHLGWNRQRDGRHWLGLSVENGRIHPPLRRALRAALEVQPEAGVMLTPHHDVLLCNVSDREAVERVLDEHAIARPEQVSRVRRQAMACPAKPTCGLAMTEAEGILPTWVDAIEEAGLGDTDVVIRMTGCPNGCVRPPAAEIGIYGYGKNDHVVLVGGSRQGDRLAHTLYERLPGEKMVPALVGLLRAVREHNTEGLPVGDFLHRSDPGTLREWIGLEA